MATPPPSLANQWIQRERSMRIRLAVVAGVVFCGFAMVVMRGVHLHISANPALESQAKNQYRAVMKVAARRGTILDGRGKELAVSVPTSSIYADGYMVKDVPSVVRSLTTLFSLSAEVSSDIRTQLVARKRYVWIKRKASPDMVAKVKAMNIPGVAFVEESHRVYPSGSLASTVLGAVGTDAEGLAGIEMAYNADLLSKRDPTVSQRDGHGRLIYSPVAFKDQVDVGSITLTIDKTIQFIAESALDRAVDESKARAGTAVVMDPKTGAILAMASSPNFNPNEYSKYPQSSWRNRAISDSFEPGSTFKVLTVATALDQGLVKEDQKFDCNRGAIKVGNATIHDHDPYGVLSVRDIIKVSSNIGAYKVGSVLGKERLYDSLRKFGIGQKTGIDFPGEAAGILRSGSKWGPVELATISFGQGVAATPLQLVSAMATFANGGVRMKPYIVQRIEAGSGEVTETTPTPVETVISPETAALVVDIMKGVVGEGGTAKRAASSEFCVAGKTGTAQKVVEGTGRYADGKYFASFVGVVPCDNPRLAIFVGVDEPKVGHFGGQIAGPVFREIAESTLNYLAVPGKSTEIVKKQEEASQGKGSSAPAQVVKAPQPVKDVQPHLEELELPNMVGWPMRRVLVAMRSADVRVELEGGGRAVSQMPQPGTVVRKGDRVRVKFTLPE